MKTVVAPVLFPLVVAASHLRPHIKAAAIDVGAYSWARCSENTPCADGLDCQWTIDLETRVCKGATGLVGHTYDGYVELKDIDINPGSDIKAEGVKSSLYECVQACKASSACFGTSQNRGDEWQCFLKSRATSYSIAKDVQSTLYYRKGNVCYGNSEFATSKGGKTYGFSGSFEDCYQCYGQDKYNAFLWGNDENGGYCTCDTVDMSRGEPRPVPSSDYAVACARNSAQ
ncbi:hypothetical protein ACHHYP_02987 [Achlya hypogyna]|uniref:Secreted protein n=1 Tax=Achlya hypogyna TaxID=1202772 RepID=A0A0A7CLX8_ACHHY|nr:secreted protein [Achlya hypogyna]OQR93040.1 hypothetical protein ACHHYP_02987 [Achlya hypogyna]